MAERVVQAPQSQGPVSGADAVGSAQRQPEDREEEPVQRKCSDCEKEEKERVQRQEKEPEEELTQRQPEKEEEKPAVQTMLLMRKAANGGYTATPALSAQLSASKGGGSVLPAPTRAHMESAFGADFSRVRIHTDRDAAEMNAGISARAFTHGSDIYFNKGQYAPESGEGRRLLAHELTHVVQQKKNDIARSGTNVRTPNYSAIKQGVLGVKTEYRAEALDDCGAAEFYVTWNTKGKDEAGWIIQHVTWINEIFKTERNNNIEFEPKKVVNDSRKVTEIYPQAVQEKPDTEIEFWEGWEVNEGKIWGGFAKGKMMKKEIRENFGEDAFVNNRDKYSSPSQGKNSFGRVKIIGKAKFLVDYPLTVPPWILDKSYISGNLPYIRNLSDWSDDNALDHKMTVAWYCDERASKTPSIVSVPT